MCGPNLRPHTARNAQPQIATTQPVFSTVHRERKPKGSVFAGYDKNTHSYAEEKNIQLDWLCGIVILAHIIPIIKKYFGKKNPGGFPPGIYVACIIVGFLLKSSCAIYCAGVCQNGRRLAFYGRSGTSDYIEPCWLGISAERKTSL